MSYGHGNLSPKEQEHIASMLTEASSDMTFDTALATVEEVDASYAERGADGGGNQHGVLGTWVAMQIDRKIASRYAHD